MRPDWEWVPWENFVKLIDIFATFGKMLPYASWECSLVHIHPILYIHTLSIKKKVYLQDVLFENLHKVVCLFIFSIFLLWNAFDLRQFV